MCGISLYLGDKYNRDAFKILSLRSDIFGRDNAGIVFWNDKGEHTQFRGGPAKSWAICFDIFKNDYFDYDEAAPLMRDLLTKKVALPETTNGKPIATFSRKATVGDTTPDFAQPFIINGTRPIMMMHNGTITNYKELLAHTELSEDGILTDSHALGRAITEEKHIEWFELYSGEITCVWVYLDNPDKVYAFVGGSKAKSGTYEYMKADRDLYMLRNRERNSFYLSRSWDAIRLVQAFLTEPNSKENLYYAYSIKINAVVQFTKESGDEIVKAITRAPYAARPRKKVIPMNNFSPTRRSSGKGSTSIFDRETLNKSSYKLDFCYGRYYLGEELIHTEVHFDPENPTTFYYVKPTYVDPDNGVMYTKKFDTEEFRLFNGISPKSSGLSEEKKAQLREHFFFEGQMFLSRELFEAFTRKNYLKSFSSTAFIGNVAHPVWSGSARRIVDKQSPNYLDPMFHLWDKVEYSASGRATYEINGPWIPLYVCKLYNFEKGRIKSIQNVKRKTARNSWQRTYNKFFPSQTIEVHEKD